MTHNFKPIFVWMTIIISGCCFGFVPAAFAQPRVFPEQPILLEPANGSTISLPSTGSTVAFRWSSVIGATRYELNFRIGNIPRPPIQTTETSLAVPLNVGATNQNTVVFWSVRAGDESGFSTQPVQTASFIVAAATGSIPTPSPTPTSTIRVLKSPKLLQPENRANIEVATAVTGIDFDWNDQLGADQFILTIYRDNEIEKQIQTGLSNAPRVSVQELRVAETFQWDVTAIQNRTGSRKKSERFSFTIGNGFLPTPTPVPQRVDFNQDQRVSALDVYLFSTWFLTNAPNGDLDNSGIQDRNDLLLFLELFATRQ